MTESGNEDSRFIYDPDKNYDEETMVQQKEIENEIATDQAFVGAKMTLEAIREEYAKEDAVYQHKIQHLINKYVSVRRTRGDGNCFYRAFGFSYLEYLIENKAEIQKFYDVMQASKDGLINLGFPAFTIEDFHENFMSVLDDVKNGCGVDKLLEIFNNQGLSDYLVVYLRLLVSGHLQKEHEFYSSFVYGDQTLQQFCQQEVEPMGKESDHIHVIALTSAVGVSVQIAYMDRGEGSGIVTHNFPQDTQPQVLLLYRPGHYDVLYPQ